MIGDTAASFAGMSLAFALRFKTALKTVGIEIDVVDYQSYLNIIGLGTFLFIAAYTHQGLYSARQLTQPLQSITIIIRSIAFWLITFLVVSLVLKYNPQVSRIFALVSCITTGAVMVIWRMSLNFLLRKSSAKEYLTKNILLVGSHDDVYKFASIVERDRKNEYKIAGYVSNTYVTPELKPSLKHLGTTDNIESLITRESIDIIVATDQSINAEQLTKILSITEKYYIELKIIPSAFKIFISSLRLQNLSGLPILGIDELPVNKHLNSLLKRCLDIFGAIIGIIISVPLIAILAVFIKLDSPGPVIYRQRRTGRYGREFYIYKLRSMRIDAEINGSQWAIKDDPRRTKIGIFLRESNLDEIPQFFNVLLGNMSLVGPRPERPELIAKFETEIPHYNPRHEVRPGITGWAQVNGLRGNTSLTDRILYDLYYIENWSIILDIRILAQTLIARKNAY